MKVRAETQRVFFALWPTDAIRARIERVTGEYARRSRGRVIPSQNLHVTLAFIGEVQRTRLQDLLEAGAGTRGSPFDLELDRIETWRGSRLLCLTASSPPAELSGLVGSLRNRLLEHDFRLKNEEFRPHVTLARDMPRRQPDTQIEPIIWSVREIALVDSQTGSNGSVYTVIRTWALAE